MAHENDNHSNAGSRVPHAPTDGASSESIDPRVKRLSRDEVDVFRSVRLEALRNEPDSFAGSLADFEAMTREEWQGLLESCAVFVGFVDSEPVGVAALIRERRARAAHVAMVYVRREQRGSGIAADLLAALDNHAMEDNVLQLELDVSAENPAALRFYDKMGFTEFGRLSCGYCHQGRYIDTVLMMKTFFQPLD